MANASIDFKAFEKLEDEYKKAPDTVGRAMDEYIHGKGLQYAQQHMAEFVPVSQRKKKGAQHARFSKPYTRSTKFNLGFEVMTAQQFNYLVFPNDGTGTSKRKAAQDFAQKGLDQSTPKIIDELQNIITKTLNGG